MAAPSMGGVMLPRGNGQTVRLPRGASLTDLAERINAEPAALITALFHLGEMITATQSVNDETLQLLGAEIGWVIQVVSPEDEDRELLETFDLTFGDEEGEEGDWESRPPVVASVVAVARVAAAVVAPVPPPRVPSAVPVVAARSAVARARSSGVRSSTRWRRPAWAASCSPAATGRPSGCPEAPR